MSSNSNLNPYAAPVTLTSIEPEVTDDRLGFSTEVTISDLRRANTSPARQALLVLYIVFVAFLLFVMGLISLAIASRMMRGGTIGGEVAIIVGLFSTGILSFAVLIGTYFARGLILARRLPFLLGDTHGWLSHETLLQIRVNSETEFNMEAVQSIRIQGECLVIRFHPSPLIFDVIPMRAFERPEAVRAFVNEWNRKQMAVINVFTDPRRLEEIMLPSTQEIPQDAVPFAGQVTTDDIRASPLFRLFRRVQWIYLGIGIGFPILVIVLGWSTFSWLTLTSLFLPWIFWKSFRRSLRPLMKPNMPIRFGSGFLDSETLCNNSFFEKSRIKWAHFQSMETSDSTIALEHCGKMKMYTLFARRQFETDADWNLAIATIRKAIPKGA